MSASDRKRVSSSGINNHELAAGYLETLFNKNANRAIEMLIKAVEDGLPLKELYLHVLQPAQHELGRLWQIGKISVADEHYCTAATQQVMAQLYPSIFSTPKNGKVLVACCVKGELHEIGMRMVADFFELEGWDTYFYSSSASEEEVMQSLIDNHADLLALSVTMQGHLTELKKMIDKVHNARFGFPLKIMVGGHPFNADPGLWQRIDADATASGAEEAVHEGNRLCRKS